MLLIWIVCHLSNHSPPRIDDHAVPVTLAAGNDGIAIFDLAGEMAARLCRCKYIGLCFDGTRAQEQFPVSVACADSEG